jgi:hypothetical protein
VHKPTFFAEFWSATAVLWLHSVPLGAGMRELYALYAYFSGPSAASTRMPRPLACRVPTRCALR